MKIHLGKCDPSTEFSLTFVPGSARCSSALCLFFCVFFRGLFFVPDKGQGWPPCPSPPCSDATVVCTTSMKWKITLI